MEKELFERVVGQNFCCSGWVSHLWFGFGIENFPLKIPIFFNSLPFGSKSTWVKAGSASYLLRVKSMNG